MKMEREKMDNAIHFLDGITSIEYDYILSDDKNYLMLRVIAVHQSGERKFYDPTKFVFIKLNQLIKSIDEITDIGERARQAINAKMQIIHLIESIRLQVEYFQTKEFDFSGIYKRLEGIIDQTKIDLEFESRALKNKFIEKQTKLITSQVETNRISKTTNILIAIFTSVAGIYYLREIFVFFIPTKKGYDIDLSANLLTIISVVLFGIIMLLRMAIKLKKQSKNNQTRA